MQYSRQRMKSWNIAAAIFWDAEYDPHIHPAVFKVWMSWHILPATVFLFIQRDFIGTYRVAYVFMSSWNCFCY